MTVFGAAFDNLPKATRRGIIRQLVTRRKRYLAAMAGRQVDTEFIVLGDKPGPGRPTEPDYHHTPFYSTKNSSLWVNRQLVEAEILEDELVWFNATLASGDQLQKDIVAPFVKRDARFIALGGNAAKWLSRNFPEVQFTTVFHPQFAKRFRSKEPYALISLLKGRNEQE